MVPFMLERFGAGCFVRVIKGRARQAINSGLKRLEIKAFLLLLLPPYTP